MDARNERNRDYQPGPRLCAAHRSCDVLLAGELDDAEPGLLEQVRQVDKLKLRTLVGSQPPAVTAQILAGSENINAPAGEFGKN